VVNIPKDLSDLLQAMATDFPAILRANLVGIYLWGSLTNDAFDETCSDVDCVAVTRRDPDDYEFSELNGWFENQKKQNPWVGRIDMRFVIDHEFLDKSSQCCGFYPYTGKLVRHGSDGNPIIWINVAQSGITLWGKDAKLIAPHVSAQCLNDALMLELKYLEQDLRSNARTDPTGRSSTMPTQFSRLAASFSQPATGHWLQRTEPTPGPWKQSHPCGKRSFIVPKITG